MQKISDARLKSLHAGEEESTHLMEFLRIDPETLLANTFPDFHYPQIPLKTGIVQKLDLLAGHIHHQFGFQKWDAFSCHPSDYVRSLACYLLAKQSFSFAEMLHRMKLLADDTNAGVREWAWLAIRADFAKNVERHIDILSPYVQDASPNIRRFASELSRPRGVWCKHIPALRTAPWLAMEIIAPLKSDTSRYVQLSVGNWLNDASKDHAAWVEKICAEWQSISPTKNTAHICKRGLRTLKKNTLNKTR